MKSLEPFRENVVVLSGLAQVKGRALGDGPGDHARATATWLTGVHPYKTGGADFKLGISADQIAAEEFGKHTQLASLELGTRAAAARRQLRLGLHLRLHVDVVAVGDQPAARRDQPARRVRAPLRRRRKHRRRQTGWPGSKARRACSITSPSSLTRLQGSLGAGDKRKLDEYLAAVRDIERRIQRAEEQNITMKLPHMERPSSIPDDYEQYCKLMMDLQVIAWQTDMTRVTSFTMGRDGSNRAYREIGISDGHHSISHHQQDPERVEKLIKIDELHTAMFGYLLQKLQETPDGDGTLLDHSLVVFGSSLSESNIHTHDDLPIVLAGNANGQVKGNRHIVYPKETPLNNLFLNMFDLGGVPSVAGFGDSTGRLTGL